MCCPGSDKGQSAQYNEHTDDRAESPDHCCCQQRSLHEIIGEEVEHLVSVSLVVMVVVFNDDEVFVRHDKVFAIDSPENIECEHVGRWTGSVQAGFQQHESIDTCANHVDVMRNE